MAAKVAEKIVVSFGDFETVTRHYDPEEGEWFTRLSRAYGVAFSTPDGLEYIHLYQFPFDDAGRARAERLARRVQAKIDAEGVDALDGKAWGVRVIYGSKLYQEEEPWIVAREKEDALSSEFFG